MILGIDPKVDYAFKHLLGREATRPILINVLESVLQPSAGHHIQDIELLNPFNSVTYNPREFDPDFINDIGPSAAIAVGLAARKVGDR